jgi:hypothetical protein
LIQIHFVRTSFLVLIIFATVGIRAQGQDAQVPARNTQNTQLDKLDPDEIVANALDRRIINRRDTLYFFYAVKPAKPIKTVAQKWYSWFGHDTVLSTAGSYNGRVLDGEYKVLYPGGNIKETGNFSMGLKTGVWRSWHPDGSLQGVDHWKNGERLDHEERKRADSKQADSKQADRKRADGKGADTKADSTKLN